MLLAEMLGDNSLFFYLLHLYNVNVIPYDYYWTIDNYHYDIKLGRYVPYTSNDLKKQINNGKQLQVMFVFEISIPKEESVMDYVYENPFEKQIKEMEAEKEEEARKMFSEIDTECNLLQTVQETTEEEDSLINF